MMMCSVPTFRKRSARNDHMETPSQQMHGGWLVAGPLPVLPFLSRWRRGNGICFGFDGGHNGQMDFPFLPACVGRAWSGQSHERKHLMDEASPSSRTGHTSSLGRQPGVRFCVSTARKQMSEHQSEAVGDGCAYPERQRSLLRWSRVPTCNRSIRWGWELDGVQVMSIRVDPYFLGSSSQSQF